MKKSLFIASGIILVLLGIKTSVLANIFYYVDKNGVKHFSNVPTNPKFKIYIKKNEDLFQTGKKTYSSKEFDQHITDASNVYGIPFPLIKAVIKTESAFNPNAVSKKGACGLMQLMPVNSRRYSIANPFNPRANIFGGTRYLKEMLEYFNGDLKLALAAYNAGPGSVEKYNKRIPPYNETINYVKKVIGYYAYYKENTD